MKPRTTPEVDLDSGPDNLDLVREFTILLVERTLSSS